MLCVDGGASFCVGDFRPGDFGVGKGEIEGAAVLILSRIVVWKGQGVDCAGRIWIGF